MNDSLIMTEGKNEYENLLPPVSGRGGGGSAASSNSSSSNRSSSGSDSTSSSSESSSYEYQPPGFRDVWKNDTKKLLGFRIFLSSEEMEVGRFNKDETLEDKLKERRLIESERTAIQLFFRRDSRLEKDLNEKLVLLMRALLKPSEGTKTTLDENVMRMIGTLISALRKLRVHLTEFCPCRLVLIPDDPDAFAEKEGKGIVCNKKFLKADIIQSLESLSSPFVDKKHFAAPFRGMIPVIPCNPPVAVFEPGTLFHRCWNLEGHPFFDEADPTLKNGETWHDIANLRCEWFFPMHYVFHRDGLPPGKHEENEAKKYFHING